MEVNLQSFVYIILSNKFLYSSNLIFSEFLVPVSFFSPKPLCLFLLSVPPSNITIVSSNTSLNLSWVPEEQHRNHGFRIRYLRKIGKKRADEREKEVHYADG